MALPSPRNKAGAKVPGVLDPTSAFETGAAPEKGEPRFLYMSQHRSLRAAATLGGKRNVLKRFERLEILKKRGQWKAGDRITGLRKTKAEA
jgi:small basic protein (TIGR04137 family)